MMCEREMTREELVAMNNELMRQFKNLEMNREFIELVVEYISPEVCPYKEYVGKPYFSIKYKEDGKTYIGYGTYNPEILSRFLKEYFMQSVKHEITEDDVIEWVQKRKMALVTKSLYSEMMKRWSAAEHSEQKDPCSLCAGLENRDSLYVYSDSNDGNGFDYIHNLNYCPVCGRKLNRRGGKDD